VVAGGWIWTQRSFGRTLMPLVRTSRPGWRASRMVATSFSICAGLALSAALASSAGVTTPAAGLAMVGVPLAAGWAVTESRVPSVVVAWRVRSWAWVIV